MSLFPPRVTVGGFLCRVEMSVSAESESRKVVRGVEMFVSAESEGWSLERLLVTSS